MAKMNGCNIRIAFGITMLVLLLAFATGGTKNQNTNVVVAHGNSIQDAVKNAVSGDTILIKSGVYNENVVIDKPVDLLGDTSGSAPIIYGGIVLNADSSTIEGFRITGADIGILVNSNNNIIKNNILLQNNVGIKLSGKDNKVFNNYFDNAQNALDSGKNKWNTERTNGSNIIGGIYIGGNYWSDYRGTDANGDGLGDTGYTSGSVADALPLVRASAVTAQEKLTLPDVPPVAKSSPEQNDNNNVISNSPKDPRTFGKQFISDASKAGKKPDPQQKPDEKDVKKPDVIKASSTAPVSKEETGLIEQLRKAKSSGDMKEAQRIEEKLAALRGEKISMIQNTDTNANSGLFSKGGLYPKSEPGVAPKWAVNDILVTGTNKSEIKPSIVHDKNGILYTAVESVEENLIRIFRSYDNGNTWYMWAWFWSSPITQSPSLAIGNGYVNSNYLLMADRAGNNYITVWRVNLTDGAWDRRTIEYNAVGVSDPSIVTDSTEFPGGWYPYLTYNSAGAAGGELKFTRSTTDFGNTWQTPVVLRNYYQPLPTTAPGIDYGGSYVYVAYEDYSSSSDTDRDIFVRTSVWGGTFNPEVMISTDYHDEFRPSVAAVKYNNTAVVAYTLAFSPPDYDVYYSYTRNHGTTWYPGNCIDCGGGTEMFPAVTASDYLGMVHAAYWHDYDITYTYTAYDRPDLLMLNKTLAINSDRSAAWLPPTITTIIGGTPNKEAGIAWQDFRNYWNNLYDPGTPNLYDVYFNAPSLPRGGGCYNYGSYPPRGVTPPKYGNWHINSLDNIECNSTTITLNGKLQIEGKLRLNNVRLKMNGTYNGQYSIDTYSGSTLHISDINGWQSEITNGGVLNANYTFRVNAGTDFKLIRSEVHNAGYAWNLDTAGNNYNNAGLWINTNNAIIDQSYIHGNSFVGLILYNSNGNKITNNNIYSNIWNGIYAENSNNNNLINNNVHNNGWDGFLVAGSNNNFSNNNVYSNGYDGFSVSGSNNIFLNNYYVYYNRHHGITVSGYNTNLTNNYVFSNADIGIAVSSNSCNIRNNNVHDQSRGIVLSSSTGCNIKNNNVLWNHWRGIDLESSPGNLLESNYANHTAGSPDAAGIILVDSANNRMTLNYASYNDNYGIRLWRSPGAIVNRSYTNYNYNGAGISLEGSGTSENSIIDINNAYGNSVGIQLYNTNGNSITNNIVTSNKGGIALYSSHYNHIRNNNASYSNDIGIGLSSSSGNDLFNNNVNSSTVGVSLRYSNANTIERTRARSDNIGIYLFLSNGNKMVRNDATNNNNEGIELAVSSNNNNISDNTINNNGNYGIHIYSSKLNVAMNNTVLSNGVGVYLDWSPYNNITRNNVRNSKLTGIALLWSSDYNNLSGNSADQNGNISIKISQSNNNIVAKNGANGSDVGIFLDWSKNNVIQKNIVNNNRIHGISTEWNSDNNKIRNNTATNNIAGLSLMWSSGNTVENNTLNGNNLSVNLEWSSNNNLVQNNGMSSNKNYGIALSWASKGNTIKNNIINHNALIGLYIRDSSNNLIYNNHFATNKINANDNGVNRWNITKTPGKNIEGGNYLGGNYWHDYTGTDTDGDGLGNTLLPYKSKGNISKDGDYLPLDPPPASITNLRNITYARNYINWTWIDPRDSDFKHVKVYINNVFKRNVSKGVRYFNATGLLPGAYMISTRTEDLKGHINLTWVNQTRRTKP